MVLLEKLNFLTRDIGVKLTDQQKDQLIQYVNLLDKWNSAYNLTSVRDPEDMLVKHIADSLVVAQHLKGKHYIDVGTGPGLPGVVLAIALPDVEFILLDSLGKRVRFLTQIKHSLGLVNIHPVQSRVENYQPDSRLDGVLSRAFASLQDMVDWCHHLIDTDAAFYALKGQFPESELSSLPENVILDKVIELSVPQLNAERNLIILKKSS